MITLQKLWHNITLPFTLAKYFAEGVKEGWNDPETKEIVKDMKTNCDLISKELQAKYERVVSARTRKWSQRHRDQKY